MEEHQPRDSSTADGGSPASTGHTASPSVAQRGVDDPLIEAIYNVEEREALLTACMWRQLNATHYALCDAMSQHHYSSIAFVFGEAAANVFASAARRQPLDGTRTAVGSSAAVRRATSAQQQHRGGSFTQHGTSVRSTSRTSATGRVSVNGDTASHVSNRSASGSYRNSTAAAVVPPRGTAPLMRRTSPMPRGGGASVLTTQRLNAGGVSVGSSTVGTRRTSVHDGSPLATRALRSVDHQSDVVTLPLGFRSVTPTRKAHLVPAPAPSVKVLFEERRRCDERKDVLTRSSECLLPPDGETESSEFAPAAARPRSAPRKLSVLHAVPMNHQRTIAAQRSPVARRTSPVRTAATSNQIPHAASPASNAEVVNNADGGSTTSVHDSAAPSEQRRVSPFKAVAGVAARGPIKSPIRSRVPTAVSPMKRPVAAAAAQRVSPHQRTATAPRPLSSGAMLSARSEKASTGSVMVSARSTGSSTTAPSTSRASPLQRMTTKERSSSAQSLNTAVPSIPIAMASLADPRRSTSATRRQEDDAAVPDIAVTATFDGDSRPQTARSTSGQASRSGSVLSSGQLRPSPRNSKHNPAHRRSSRMSAASSCSAQEPRQVIDYALEVLKCGINRTLEVDIVPQPLMTPLQPNDLLLEVDGKSMSTLDQLRAHFELMYRPRAAVPLTTSVSILRGTEYLIVDVPLPRVIVGQTAHGFRMEDVPEIRESSMDGLVDVAV